MQVADPLDIHASLVSNVIVWGNPTSTSVLDVLHGSVHASGGSSIPLQNCVDEELIQIISQAVMERTDAIVQVRRCLCVAAPLPAHNCQPLKCCARLECRQSHDLDRTVAGTRAELPAPGETEEPSAHAQPERRAGVHFSCS